MNEIRRKLERQAAWQRSRRDIPWPEKVRIAETMRAAMLEFRRKTRPVGADPSASRVGD